MDARAGHLENVGCARSAARQTGKKVPALSSFIHGPKKSGTLMTAEI